MLGAACATAGAAVEPLPDSARGPVSLAPGVSLGRLEREGGQVIHILRAQPRGGVNALVAEPGGNTAFARSPVSTVVRRGRARGIVAGLNGDFFNFSSGHPSGIFMRDGRLVNEPEPGRSSLAVTGAGMLAAMQPLMSGSWEALDETGRPTGPRGDIDGLNRTAERGRETLVYTADAGPSTPSAGSRFEATIALETPAPLQPNVPLVGRVVAAGPRGDHPIGSGRIVISAVGADGPDLVAGLPLGTRVRVSAAVAGLPDDVVSAVGGGPELVRDGIAIADAGETFSPGQLDPSAPRSAVGQRVDGTLLMVAVQGPVHGSRGMSNRQLATLMVQLGARTAVAMDAGGSTSLAAADGPVLPGGERSVTNAVALRHDGVSIEPLPRTRITPNRDGVAERFGPAVSVPHAGVLTVEVTRRRGATRRITRRRLGATVRRFPLDPARLRLADGPYRLTARLVPGDGSAPSTHSREFIVDRTLENLRSAPRRYGGRARLDIRFRLNRRARVTVWIEDAGGRRIRTLVPGRLYRAGERRLLWNRRAGGEVREGAHRVVVVARSGLGTTGLIETVVLPAAPDAADAGSGRRRP